MRATLLALACAALAARAEAPGPAAEALRSGLLANGRVAREEAVAAARALSRTDPAGVAALWDGLDLRGRCLLAAALGSAGTSHAAAVAWERVAASPEPEIFRALLDALPQGGEKALFAEAPGTLSPARRAALGELRLRWRVEAEFARLKSSSGPTGHYEGQFERLKALGPEITPVLFDIVEDRARPLPGEGGAGPYRTIHPDVLLVEPQELRVLAACSFGEVCDPADEATAERLEDLFTRWWKPIEDEERFESDELAPAIAFSLFDLGRDDCVSRYIARLNRVLRDYSASGLDQMNALWELGYANIRIGNYQEGEYYYRLALDRTVSRAIAAYNLACNFATRARRETRDRAALKDKALGYLEDAVHKYNYGDWKWMEEDGDLAFIRDEPRYRAILAYLQQKYPERKKGKVSKRGSDFLGGGK